MSESSGIKAMCRAVLVSWLMVTPSWLLALTTTLTAPGVSEDLQDRLTASSSVMAAETNGLTTPQELIAAAVSDYRTLIQVLYGEGYFSPVINIRINGQEAAQIPPLSPPARVDTIAISINSGPSFRFGRANVAPLAPGSVVEEGFRIGETATTGLLRDVAADGVSGWREAGFPKASVGDQTIRARNAEALLDADIELLPGPRLRFGRLKVPQDSWVNAAAIAKIAAFPTGEIYSPATVQRVGMRLRRTGSFSSVTIREAKTPNPDGTLDFEAVVEDQVPRRVSFGAEIASETGIELSAKWIHRNLFGSAERFQIEGRVSNIGGSEAIDGLVALRLDRPARFGGDNNQFFIAGFGRDNQPNYSLTRAFVGAGVRRTFSDRLFAEASVTAEWNKSDDAFGKGRKFQMIPLPILIEWDQRDIPVNATSGFFLKTIATPYIGLSGTKSGLSLWGDARGYYGFGDSKTIVLAGRVQAGTILGPSLADISPQYLFYSGGAGTVRGQPYESLGVPVGTGLAGGRSILALSAEIRGKVTDTISLVGFFDAAAVDEGQFVNDSSPYHSGAGVGIRYDLGGLGPLRFDVGFPVEGTTDDGVQFYLGIGQAF